MASQAVVELIVDASDAERDVNRQIRDIADRAEDQAPTIDLNVDIDRTSLQETENQLGDLGDSADETSDQLRRTGNALDDFLLRVHQSTDGTSRFDDAVRGMSFSVLRGAGNIAQLGARAFAMGTAVGGAVPVIGSLVGAIAAIGPAAAAGVSGMATIQLASATLKLGLLGVSDALEEAFQFDSDPEKVAEALERLSPSARAFTKELIGMKSELRKLQLGIQERLFKNLDKTVRGVAKAALPELRRATFDIAESFNDMGKGIGRAVKDLDKSGALQQATEGAATSLKTLIDVPGNIVKSLGKIAAAGTPLLDRFATKVDEVTSKIASKIDKAYESGALEKAIDAAGDALAQLGRIAGNLGGVLKNVFGAATKDGGALFDTLETLTQSLEDATSASGFADALSALSETAGVLAKEIGPVLGEVFKALGGIFQELAKPVQGLIRTLGGDLVKLLKALQPTFRSAGEAVGLMLDALSPLLDLFTRLAIEILPVLNPFLQTLKDQIREATPYIEEMAKELGDLLVPAIQQLVPALAEQARLMTELALIALPLLVEGLRAAGPLIELFFLALTKGLQIVALFQESLTIVANQFRTQLLPAIITIIEYIGRFIEKMKQLAIDVFQGVVPAAIGTVVDLLQGDFNGALNNARETASRSITAISNLFGSLPGRVRSALSSFGSTLSSVGSSALSRMLSAVRTGQDRVVSHIRGLPGKARSALGNLGSVLYGSGQALIRGFVNGIESMVQRVRNAVSKVVSAAGKFFPHSPAEEGPFSGRGWTKFSGEALMRDFAAGVEAQTNALRSTLDKSLSVPVVDSAGAFSAGQDVGTVAFNAGDQTIAPVVQVRIGNEAVDRYVDVRVAKSHRERDRQTTQGARF